MGPLSGCKNAGLRCQNKLYVNLVNELGHYPIRKRARLFSVYFGGPVETILTGSIGVLLLFVFRKSFYASKSLSLPQWGIIFTSLFWLRQPTNFAIWIVGFLLTGKFSGRSDKVMLSRMLNIPDATLSATTAAIGATVLTFILFKFIPFSQRLTFVLSGLSGGITGYLLWLKVLGKYFMP